MAKLSSKRTDHEAPPDTETARADQNMTAALTTLAAGVLTSLGWGTGLPSIDEDIRDALLTETLPKIARVDPEFWPPDAGKHGQFEPISHEEKGPSKQDTALKAYKDELARVPGVKNAEVRDRALHFKFNGKECELRADDLHVISSMKFDGRQVSFDDSTLRYRRVDAILAMLDGASAKLNEIDPKKGDLTIKGGLIELTIGKEQVVFAGGRAFAVKSEPGKEQLEELAKARQASKDSGNKFARLAFEVKDLLREAGIKAPVIERDPLPKELATAPKEAKQLAEDLRKVRKEMHAADDALSEAERKAVRTVVALDGKGKGKEYQIISYGAYREGQVTIVAAADRNGRAESLLKLHGNTMTSTEISISEAIAKLTEPRIEKERWINALRDREKLFELPVPEAGKRNSDPALLAAPGVSVHAVKSLEAQLDRKGTEKDELASLRAAELILLAKVHDPHLKVDLTKPVQRILEESKDRYNPLLGHYELLKGAGPSATEPLAEALRSGSPAQQKLAAGVLDSMNNSDTTPILKEALKRRETSEDAKLEISVNLMAKGDRQGIELLKKHAADGVNSPEGHEAMRALADHGTKEDIAALLDIAKKKGGSTVLRVVSMIADSENPVCGSIRLEMMEAHLTEKDFTSKDFDDLSFEIAKTLLQNPEKLDDQAKRLLMIYRARPEGYSRIDEAIQNMPEEDRKKMLALNGELKDDKRLPAKTRERLELFERAGKVGIELPARFTTEDLTEIVKNRESPKPDGRPLAIVVYSKADHNGAFNSIEHIATLRANGYRVMYYEARTDREFVDSAKEAAGLGKKDQQKADLLIIGGHGRADGVFLGEGQTGESGRLDLGDEKMLRDSKVGEVLAKDGQIVFQSCSTGKGEKGADNMANLLREIFPHALKEGIWAPNADSGGLTLEFKEKKLKKVEYGLGAKAYRAESGRRLGDADPYV